MSTERQNNFPLSEALLFSLRSIRSRLGRMFVVLLGIACAIAFMGTLLTLGEIMSGLLTGEEGEASSAFARRSWLVIAVLISAAGITNAILMSVTERIREIGTLKCLGAMDRHIVQIFLFEAVLLGAIGGVAGGALGYFFAAVTSWLQHGERVLGTVLDPLLALRLVGFCALISVAICLVSAIYPVIFAARLEPASAIRHEV